MSWIVEPSSCNSGYFYAQITVDSNSTSAEYGGFLTNISNVDRVDVTSNTDNNITTVTPDMVVIGCGFQETTSDASLASENVLTFNMTTTVNGNEYPVRGYVSETTDNTVTKIIVVFSMLSPVNTGDLYLKVFNEAAGITSNYSMVATVSSATQYIDVSDSNLTSTSSSLVLTGYGFDGYPSSCRNAFTIVAENNHASSPVKGTISMWSFSQLQIDFNALSPLNYGTLTCQIGVVCTDVSDIDTCDYITNMTTVATVVSTIATLDESTAQIRTDKTDSFRVNGAGFDALETANNKIKFSSGNSEWIELSGYDCTLSSSSTTTYVDSSDECQDRCETSTSCKQYVYNNSADNATCVLYENTSMTSNTLPTLSSDNITCGYLRPDVYANIIKSSISSLVMTFDQLGPMQAPSGETELKLAVDVEGSPGYSDVTTVALVSAPQISIATSRIDTISTLSSLVTIHGTGFDDTFPRYNEVEFSDSSLVSGYVIQSSRTTLVMSLWKLSHSLSSNVTCTVQHYLRNVSGMTSLADISSANSTCFQVNITDPIVTEST